MSRRNPLLAFPALLLAAVALQLVALPDPVAPARPLWVPMALAYWTYLAPRHPSLLLAWLTGVALDVLFNTTLGQHALGLVLTVYLVARLRKFLLVLPFWQTTLVLLPVWAAYAFLMFWIDGASGQQADAWSRWLPVASSAILWPFLFPIFSSLGRPGRE